MGTHTVENQAPRSMRVPKAHEKAFNEDLAHRRVPGLWVYSARPVLFPLFIGMDY